MEGSRPEGTRAAHGGACAQVHPGGPESPASPWEEHGVGLTLGRGSPRRCGCVLPWPLQGGCPCPVTSPPGPHVARVPRPAGRVLRTPLSLALARRRLSRHSAPSPRGRSPGAASHGGTAGHPPRTAGADRGRAAGAGAQTKGLLVPVVPLPGGRGWLSACRCLPPAGQPGPVLCTPHRGCLSGRPPRFRVVRSSAADTPNVCGVT